MEYHCQHNVVEPKTPASTSSFSFSKAEDSGYTSFTPGSMERSDVSENVDPKFLKRKRPSMLSSVSKTPHIGQYFCHSIRCFESPILEHDSFLESPSKKKGTKRSYEGDPAVIDYYSVNTPTSIIAGGIQRLNVNDSLVLGGSRTSPESAANDSSNISSLSNISYTLSYPTTPVKRICRGSQQSSPLRSINNLCCPPRRSAKKLNYSIHCLSGELHVQVCKPKLLSKAARKIFRPDVKTDIINKLYHEVRCLPAINKIFSYLSNEDIYNFSLVSATWLNVCDEITKAKSKKEEYVEHITATKENHATKKNGKDIPNLVTGQNVKVAEYSLKDIHNVIHTRNEMKHSPKRSPPTTPRTRRFKTFIKSASLDSRIQLSCIRCRQPAKVTEEASGEQWAACTATACGYNFCRFCKCDRHPDKLCFQYDLNGPSPSKRKKSPCGVGTKKSKRNLRRLLN